MNIHNSKDKVLDYIRISNSKDKVLVYIYIHTYITPRTKSWTIYIYTYVPPRTKSWYIYITPRTKSWTTYVSYFKKTSLFRTLPVRQTSYCFVMVLAIVFIFKDHILVYICSNLHIYMCVFFNTYIYLYISVVLTTYISGFYFVSST